MGYVYDRIGRPKNVSGSGYAGVSSYVNSTSYRAFGLKQMTYNNGRTLSLQYDNRLRVTQWNIPSVMGWNYAYQHFDENTGRVTYAQNINDPTLDRSYHYDHVGRLQSAYTGSSARAHVELGSNWLSDGPYAQQDNVYDVWGNTLSRTGWGGTNPQYGAGYSNNKMIGMLYDDAGNLKDAGGGWTFTHDATGQQATSAMGNMQMFYDGDRLRGKKSENGAVTYYLRSSVLGGQVVAELNSSGAWSRGYVYLGGEVVAVQQGGVYWMHQDPVAKSKRVTDGSGNVVSVVELDPWGGETNRSSNEAFQPRKFTTYERDSIGSDDAMHRRYNRWWARFEQPDPYDGSYDLTDPQSFNRYSYVQNDPVNFVDPTGLDEEDWGQILNCVTRADLGIGILDFVFGWQGPCGGGGGSTGGDGGGGGGHGGGGAGQGAPQNTGQQTEKDCYAFAALVDVLANSMPSHTNVEFRDLLMDRFSERSSEFGSDRFRPEFQDYSGSRNQARHYVGGLFAGHLGGHFGTDVGSTVANLVRESTIGATTISIAGATIPFPTILPPDASQTADRALNVVAGRHGAALHARKIGPRDLADLIRNEVCAPR